MIRVSIWTAVFLVVLRICIGWHFLFEGVYKIRSTYAEGAEGNKPFTSEGYFREAEGPTGPLMREFLGDPDAQLLAELKIKPGDDDSDPARTPDALDAEWRAYLGRFAAAYKLDEPAKQLAESRLKQAESEYVRWLTKGTKKVAKKSPAGGTAGDGEVTVPTPIRVAEYESKLREIRDTYDRLLPAMRRDVAKTNLRTMKADAAAMRTDLRKDLDEAAGRMKDSLAKVLGTRSAGFVARLPDADADETMLAVLDLGKSSGDGANRMPKALADQWDAYAAFAKDYATAATDPQKARGDENLDRAKQRFVRWLDDRDEYSGLENPEGAVRARRETYAKSVAAYRAAEPAALLASGALLVPVSRPVVRQREAFEADVKRHTDTMKNQLGLAVPDDQAKGYAPPDAEAKKPPVHALDWATRYGLTLAGGLLVLGLFTRPACLGAAFFLLMTYLATPAFPWLPASPMNEGNYVFVNKNVVEFFALLALMTTRSGRWLGLDAWVMPLFVRKKKAGA